ncbi:uncharacterized protein EV422DRAFT_330596 [Fimicolochytrium jonesii]|uniref:uncharacterized protein n=1 Tax=Fimicolochytrium jonesii TaxID=1396493 RepID=UPI0022FDE0D5|nr:uncharacterized protein EV422DRAFT_330596 [Fimicolochytrium jonesii]KAI8816039.1 hypothetical protein EV422DRAFT_330596 [Fimicolochytrium jonesii]
MLSDDNKPGSNVPAVLNQFDGATYLLEDTSEYVTLSMFVPAAFDPKHRKGDAVEIHENKLRIKIAEDGGSARVQGWFLHPMKKAGSLWGVEKDQKTGVHVLTVELAKTDADPFLGPPAFPVLFASGYETPTPLPKDAELDDLDPHSLFLLANFLLQRLKTTERAHKMYEKAAKRGSIKACLKLGAWYQLGKEAHKDIPVDRDGEKAFEYHKIAADAGNAEACFLVGQWHAPMTDEGEADSATSTVAMAAVIGKPVSSPDDFGAAAQYLEKAYTLTQLHPAADKDFTKALLWRLGNLYNQGGETLPINDHTIRRSFECFQIAGETLGHPPALYNLAIYTLSGFGTEQDVQKGFERLDAAVRADPTLVIAPPLGDLDESGRKVLIAVFEEARKNGITERIPLQNLIERTRQVVEVANGIKGAPVDASITPTSKPARKSRKSASKRKPSKSSTRNTSRPWTNLEVTLTVSIVAAVVGVGAWAWIRRSR